MKSRNPRRRRSGTFSLTPDRTIYGELKIRGEATFLYLHDRDFFPTHEFPNRCIKGVLHDLTHVTLIDCVAPPVPGSVSRGEEGYHFAKVLPHFVVQGDAHIDPELSIVREISFLLDDVANLFEDFDAFGSVFFNAQPLVDQIVKAHVPDRPIETGENAQLIYFTGKTELCTVDTIYGEIIIQRRCGFNFGGSRGASLQNKVACSIRFREAIAFREAISRVSVVVDYFGMLVGRPQNLLSLGIQVGSESDKLVPLEVYWSHAPQRDKSGASKKPNAFDVLLDGAREPQQFAEVLKHWLERQETWHSARWRFFRAFDKQRHYDPDRLIGAANMFDILPLSAAPSDVPLTQDLDKAREASRTLFRALPKSLERDSILNDLGRLGKSHLKHKVRYRAQKVIDVGGEWFPDLFEVTDEAVNCRNYYVHGTLSHFDYDRNFDLVTFFTDTLEFLFAASDLLEAGWDIRSWIKRGTTMSHPFARYHENYSLGLRHLNEVLAGCPGSRS